MALALVGAHHVGNALAAAAVALELGGTPDGVAAALGAATPASRWRMEVTDRPDGVTVINDAYNANPDSMRAALEALTAVGAGRRTWAVLGRMAELGDEAAAAHAGVAAAARRLGVRRAGRGGQPRLRRAPARWPAIDEAARRCCAPSCGPATWCWSRRPARPAWRGWPPRCS